MADNQYVNKVVINGVTQVDLTGDSVTPQTLMKGVTAHDASGAPIVGSYVPNTDHAELSNLDYEHSGHTGFQPAISWLSAQQIGDMFDDIMEE